MRPTQSNECRRARLSAWRKTSFQPAFEALEQRQLLAAAPGTLLPNFPGDKLPGPIVSPPSWAGPVMPNDPSFSKQWDLHNDGTYGTADADIDAPEAWGWTTGSTRTTIAVVDTGVDYTHPDLARNIWINQAEIPDHIRNNLTDIDHDGRITFWDLNDPVNQGFEKANDVNHNGYIDGGDLIAREYHCLPDYKPGQDPNEPPDCTYVGGMANGLDDGGNGYTDDLIGWDFQGDDNNPMDGKGHGTHVAGTIGAVGNNPLGISGINWKTQIMPLRIRLPGQPSFGDVLSNPLKYLEIMQDGESQAIRAIRYAVANGARVSNHSWGAEMSDLQAMFEEIGEDLGLYEGFDDLKHAIDDAGQAGHIVVMAAGNAHRNIDTHVSYPAGLGNANMITVAATDSNDQLAGYSNYGLSNVDLAAPGTDVYSTLPISGPAASGSAYDYMSGTSMAAPHVTGVVGLVWSQHPAWTKEQVIAQVEGTAQPLASLAGQVKTGGRLNAFRAVTPGPWITAPHNNSFREIDRPVSSVRIVFNEAIKPATFAADDVVVESQLSATTWEPVTVTGVQVVPNSGNRDFDISFAGSGPGTYRFTIGPNIESASGYLMDIDRDGTGGEATDDRHRFTVRMTMDYLKNQGPLADAERLRNFIQTISVVPKDVLGKVRTTMVSQIVVHYSLPMDAKAAGKLTNYALAAPGADGLLGTRDDRLMPLRSVKYDAKQQTLTLTPKALLPENQLFRLTLKQSGLVDRSRRQLDGDGDGAAGGNLVMDIARGTHLKYFDQYRSQVDLILSGGGAMELFLSPTGAAQQLRLVKTVAGQSALAASVQPASAAGPIVTTLGAISAPTSFLNKLPANVRVGGMPDEAATDELFASGDVVGKFRWIG